MKITRLKIGIGAGLAAVFVVGVTVYASTSVIMGVGTFAHFDPFGGPATMTTRTLSIGANEILGWHQHPGVGAYTIVKSGTLTIEDGCGGESYVREAQVTGCTTPPDAPANLTITPSGSAVALTWSVPASGATSYVVRAGSAPGLSDYADYETGSTVPTLTAAAPPGTYYVRVHARNGCGLGGASNEFILVL